MTFNNIYLASQSHTNHNECQTKNQAISSRELFTDL